MKDVELREKVAEIMFLKLGIDMATTETQYPLIPSSDRDAFLDKMVFIAEEIVTQYNQHLKKACSDNRMQSLSTEELDTHLSHWLTNDN